MTQGEILLRAIAADPFDDAPRYAYVDWLLEQGGPTDVARANFIMAQLKNRTDSDLATVASTIGRIDSLVQSHPWCLPIKRITVPSALRVKNGGQGACVFVRGLPHHIEATMGEFSRKAKEIFRWPVVSVRLPRVFASERVGGTFIHPHGGYERRLLRSFGVHDDFFSNATEALEYLVRTLVNWGRGQAGLPSLGDFPVERWTRTDSV